VAAVLLKDQGYDLIGVFMKFWSPLRGSSLITTDKETDLRGYNRCCSPEAEVRARKVAKILDIPFYVFNFEKEFKKRVVDYFIKEYKEGRTPNPCVVCNKEIKFGFLLEKALKLDADFVATGHYALKREITNHKSQITNYKLFKGKDNKKDQSYFLWQLNQKQLKHILFPVGNYIKDKVRALAKKFKLPVSNIPESQEICFIQDNINDFLRRYIKTIPGRILNIDGKEVGQHQGLPFYTIGQRKGIKLSGGPYYVIDKDFKKNNLIVANFLDNKNLYKKSLIAKNVSWVAGKEPKFPIKIYTQIRYRHKPVLSTIAKKLKNGTIEVVFNQPQRAITPGQSVVFYKNHELLGGGVILS